eukprot:TRINITY_DN46584_c0_g1_i2.p1 TRINITY_DN46584_c0_g1~~TRINITY_DN46584_c0_g1_i2.p1  ORF type:complete len:198 (+),score=40.20 TRINITY_DN46584_c0_g1_i2:147-740(+)
MCIRDSACAGSLQTVHRECLLHWISRSEVPSHCEVCKDPFPEELREAAVGRHALNSKAEQIIAHFQIHRAAQLSRATDERLGVETVLRARLAERRLRKAQEKLAEQQALRRARDLKATESVRAAQGLMDCAIMGGGCSTLELQALAMELRAQMREFDSEGGLRSELQDWAITLEQTAADGYLTRDPVTRDVDTEHIV